MRKEFVYFVGGWYTMLVSNQIHDLIHINNIFIDFIVTFIIFFCLYELGMFICSKVAKTYCNPEMETKEYYIESIKILNKCINYWKGKADTYEEILENKYDVKDELFKKIAELEAENEANENGAKKYAEFYFKTEDQLTRAKVIIKKLCSLVNFLNGDDNCKEPDVEEAEQFLKEIEE